MIQLRVCQRIDTTTRIVYLLEEQPVEGSVYLGASCRLAAFPHPVPSKDRPFGTLERLAQVLQYDSLSTTYVFGQTPTNHARFALVTAVFTGYTYFNAP